MKETSEVNSCKESTADDLERGTEENGSALSEGGVSSGGAAPEQVLISRMEKDPLNIGVPLPVLRMSPSPPPARTNADAAVVDEDDATAVDAVKGTVKPDPRAVAVGLDYATGTAASTGGQSLSSATVPMLKSVKRYASVQTSDAHVAESTNEELMANATALSLEVHAGLPGGFAVGGPASEDEEASLEEGAFCRNSSTQPTTSTHVDEAGYLVEATLVSDQHDQSVVHAEAQPLRRFPFARTTALALVIAVIVIVVLATVLGTSGSNNDDSPTQVTATSSPTNAPLPTLERIRRSGSLKCGGGTGMIALFAHLDSVGERGNESSGPNNNAEGARNFSVGFCSAIAAAVLGNASAFEIVARPEEAQFQSLYEGEIDLLISRIGATMKQDVYEETSGQGIANTIPYLYSGVGFTGPPEYVHCGENDIQTFGNCSDTKICVQEHSYYFVQELLSRIPRRHIVILNSTLGLFTAFLAGQCNLLATEGSELSLSILKAFGYKGNLTVSKREYTTELFALASLDSDPDWADFLNAITMALLYAEEVGITKETAERIGETSLFGDEYKTMFVDAIKTVGNFGELYSFPMPRTSRNLPNDGTTGLLASPPLGDVGMEHHGYNDLGPRAGGTLETVLERRRLHCGVRGGRPGFASLDSDQSTWSGMDVDFCTALAAGLFDGEDQNVRFFDVYSSTSSNGFLLLHNGSIDVFAGSVWTLESDMRENATQTGFAFSQPYFYSPANDSRFPDENLCLATREDDPQWSSFVYWTAQSIVYAEEHDVVQSVSSQMPLIGVFGLKLQRMFRDAVHSIGNYNEVYERNLASMMPRAGRNALNLLTKEGKGPLRYLPPGFGAGN